MCFGKEIETKILRKTINSAQYQVIRHQESELFQVDNFQQQNYFDSDIHTESAIEV